MDVRVKPKSLKSLTSLDPTEARQWDPLFADDGGVDLNVWWFAKGILCV